jgi:hypothetical protein
MVKTFAQLKRDLQVGVKVKTIFNACKLERNGEVRSVAKKQTNAIAFLTSEGKESFLWWPKTASLVEYEDNTFKLYVEPNQWNDNQRTLVFVYEILG